MTTDTTTTSRWTALALTAGIVSLTLTTAFIHSTLGGLLFLLNATGYVGLAGLMVVAASVRIPIVQRFSWFPRVALAGYAAVTILGYLVIGPYMTLGWITKGIEILLLGLLALDVRRVYGGPRGLVRVAWRSVALVVRQDASEQEPGWSGVATNQIEP